MRLFLLLYVLLSPHVSSHSAKGSIQLTLKNLEVGQGSVRLAIYDNSADFEQQGKTVYGTVITDFSEKEKKIALPELGFGQYAIAVYQDLNNNKKLDKTVLGIPKEPYAFSNNPTVKWNPPSFAESKFQLQNGALPMEIRLRAWKDY